MIRFLAKRAWGDGSTGRFGYRLAGQTLVSDVPLGLVSAFASEAPEFLAPPLPEIGLEADAAGRSAEGWLGGAIRRVVCRAGESGYELLIPGVARFWVARSGEAIACGEVESGIPSALLEEVLLGPPLTLALALRGVWCLHASALLGAGGLILALGASAQGKSTLAAHCHLASGLRRVADDILPCSLVEGVPWARPHFPQLKLAAEQYPPAAADGVPVAALVMLAPCGPGAAVALQPLPRATALKATAEQTVAVRLFDPPLHRAHLELVAALVGAVPCYRLPYPHDYGQLPEVYGALAGL